MRFGVSSGAKEDAGSRAVWERMAAERFSMAEPSPANPAFPGLLEADSTVTPARLSGTLINAKGDRVFTYTLTAAGLAPA